MITSISLFPQTCHSRKSTGITYYMYNGSVLFKSPLSHDSMHNFKILTLKNLIVMQPYLMLLFTPDVSKCQLCKKPLYFVAKHTNTDLVHQANKTIG